MARHAIGWLSVLALWLGLAGCGGGGGSSASSDGEPVGTPQAPAFEVLYPGSNAATGASSLPVVGRITSGGAEVTGVSMLAGGGEVQAALDANGHWRGVVEVAAGNNRIQVLAQRSGAAAVEVASVNVERTLLLNRPGTTAADGDGLFVEDAGQIYRLTASGAALDPVATPPVGASAFAVNGNTLWVRVGDAIEAIDLQTGERAPPTQRTATHPAHPHDRRCRRRRHDALRRRRRSPAADRQQRRVRRPCLRAGGGNGPRAGSARRPVQHLSVPPTCQTTTPS